MKELIAHLIGDYVLQSHWQATEKVKKSFACLVHVLLYGVPFYFIGASWTALFVIVSTHFLIDRFRLAKYVCYAKQFIAPKSTLFNDWTNYDCSCGICNFCNGQQERLLKTEFSWQNCKDTGFPSETPPFLAVWLLIIVDNTMHLCINFLALRYL